MNIIKKKLDILSFGTLFKIIYLCLVLISFNNLLYQTPVKTVFIGLTTVMGILFLLYRLICFKSYWKTPYLWVLILFCISYVISAVVNWKYGLMENVKGLLWTAFQIFLLFACCTGEKPEQYRREFRVLSYVFVGYTFVSALISIGQLIVHYCITDYSDASNPIVRGVIWGRLWGVYTDPNYGAVLACVSFMISLYLLLHYRKKIARALMILNMVFEFLYITFSGSRTGQLCFAASLILFLLLYFSRKKKESSWKNRVVSFLLAVVIGMSSFLVFPLTRAAYNAADSVIYPLFNHGVQIDPSEQLGRDSEEGGDISNRRFSLWGSGMEVFVTTPIFGTSFRNLIPYTQEHLPDTYLVNNDHKVFYTTHNSFIDLLVSQGVVGASFMLCFMILVLIAIFRFLPKLNDRDFSYASILFVCIAGVALSMVLISDGFYINSGGAFILWMSLGYLMQLIQFRRAEGFDSKQRHADTAVVTFHRARNYGTCLQAVALQKALEQCGANTVLLDYQPDFIEDSFGVFHYELWRQEKGLKRKLVFLMKTVFKLPRNVKREWNFETFRDRFYCLSEGTYQTKRALDAAKLPYRTYFFGSDQIWNPQLTQGVCGTYYGDFVPDKAIKASYAASIGISDISDVEEEIKRYVNTLDFIGVRERNARDLLTPLTDKEIVINADPTLLINPEEWVSMTHDTTVKRPYLLVYALEINDELIRTASNLAKEKKLPIVFFDTKNRYGCEVISRYAADPIEFLSLLRGASYVITNSFHGTVFSVVFEKQFLCIPHKTRASRLVNLLEDLGLTQRIQYTAEEKKNIDAEIDYTSVKDILKQKREQSLGYLKQVLESKREQNG